MELSKENQYIGGNDLPAKTSDYKKYMLAAAAALLVAIVGLSYVAINLTGSSDTSEDINSASNDPNSRIEDQSLNDDDTKLKIVNETEIDTKDKTKEIKTSNTEMITMFTSPSKEVTCESNENDLIHCYLRDQNWDIKVSDQVVCDGAGSPQGVRISMGEAKIGCNDWFFVESSAILEYGETYETDFITCVSKKVGIQCNHINGESFIAGPNIYPLDTVENNRSFVTSSGNIFCTGETGVRCTLNYGNQTSEGTDCEYLPKAVGNIQTLTSKGVLSHHDECVLNEQELDFEKNLPILKDGGSIEYGQISCKYMDSTLSCKHADANGFSMDEKTNLITPILN